MYKLNNSRICFLEKVKTAKLKNELENEFVNKFPYLKILRRIRRKNSRQDKVNYGNLTFESKNTSQRITKALTRKYGSIICASKPIE